MEIYGFWHMNCFGTAFDGVHFQCNLKKKEASKIVSVGRPHEPGAGLPGETPGRSTL
jgi:hypothetical protein